MTVSTPQQLFAWHGSCMTFGWILDCGWCDVRSPILNYNISHQQPVVNSKTAWGWFSIKMLSYQYRDSHHEDETFMTPSYLCTENSIFIESAPWIQLSNWQCHTFWQTPASKMLVNLGALKSSILNKVHIFQCIDEFFLCGISKGTLKFHTKYLAYTLKDMIFIQCWKFMSSQIHKIVCVFETLLGLVTGLFVHWGHRIRIYINIEKACQSKFVPETFSATYSFVAFHHDH